MIKKSPFHTSVQIIFLLIILSVLHFEKNSLWAQSFDFDFGPRSKGMGYANTTMADEWAIFNNVAGISNVKKGTIGFAYDRFFNIEGFDKVALVAVQPTEIGSIGLSTFRFGDELYSEQLVSAGFGNKIGFVRLGARINYFQIRIDEYGTSSAFFVDLGGMVELVPHLSFGAYISNLTVSRLNNYNNTRLPVIMKIGVSYHPTEDIFLNIDLCKDVEYDPVLKMGLEYRVVKKVFLRTGINSSPFKAFFGGGMQFGRFKMDYAVTSHEFLGLSHGLGIGFYYQK